VKRLWPLLFLLTGCPSSCQQRRDIQAGEQIKVEIGKAETENTTQTKKGSTVTKDLRPDGTPWRIVEHKEDEKLEIDRELLERAEEVSQAWIRDTTTTRPWYYMPAVLLTSSIVGALLALLVNWLRKFHWTGRR
jgi:hypothetical protein